jgi:hypothetical protein
MLTISNYIFTVIFTVEMLIKVVSVGFYFAPNAYLKSGWNKMDFFLVFVSALDVIITLCAKNDVKILSLLRVFRIMRTLRPLRAINSAPGLKLVVNSLITSLRPIGNTVLICIAFFSIFAILGVQVCKKTSIIQIFLV